MSTLSDRRLGHTFVRAGVITEQQLDDALANAAGRSLVDVLTAMNIADESELAQAVASAAGVPFVDLEMLDVDPAAASLVPTEVALRYVCLPFSFEGDVVVIALADPSDVLAIDDLRVITRRQLKVVVAASGDITRAIDRISRLKQNLGGMIEDLTDVGDPVRDENEDDPADEGAPAGRVMSHIIATAVRQRAGDIFIEPQETHLRIRYRIDGVCQEAFKFPRRLQRQLLSRLKISCGMDIAERRLPQDGRFSATLEGQVIDFRVAILPGVQGEMAVIRLLYKNSILMSLEDLGFLDQPMQRILEAISKPYGALLVTGPTGSGKSTTLYAAINRTASPRMNLITVEDPVEYRLEGLSQVQVHDRAGLSFAASLRSILRQDPDAVMVGEIRDKETATIAIEAALTGHLVLTTLHTNNAPSALTRLTEMGVEPFLTASAVNCVLAQRLARRLCPECKQPYTPDPVALERVGYPFEPDTLPTIYRAVGCKRCAGIGYRGRLGVHEVMTVTEEIERACVEHATAEEIAHIAVGQGMLTLRDDGFRKVALGVTSIEEVLRVVV